ncbi:hypothetical protein ACQPXM_04570 [Kribbella sp. CA-253562]|uniref:hypothetical protein n=1 Tax=Kribbella sp. CA-253562 TaxID=3239942 RepID=UPI003D913434
MAVSTTIPSRLAPAALGPTQLVIGLLVCTDLVMLVLHLAHRSVQVGLRVPVVKSAAFNISSDHGIAESFGYVQLFWAVLLLVWLGLFGRRRSYLPWALLFGYLLVDDFFGLHEAAGTALVDATGRSPEQLVFAGVRLQDLGELGFALSVGLVLLALLVWGYLRGTARTRATYRRLFGLSLLLAVFGMLVDGLATGVGDSGLQLLHLLEDGGELLAMTAVLGYVVSLVVGER